MIGDICFKMAAASGSDTVEVLIVFWLDFGTESRLFYRNATLKVTPFCPI
jgi:hypothetical protein